jgi:hypothetical protein
MYKLIFHNRKLRGDASYRIDGADVCSVSVLNPDGKRVSRGEFYRSSKGVVVGVVKKSRIDGDPRSLHVVKHIRETDKKLNAGVVSVYSRRINSENTRTIIVRNVRAHIVETVEHNSGISSVWYYL